jgi:hypothetical protein
MTYEELRAQIFHAPHADHSADRNIEENLANLAPNISMLLQRYQHLAMMMHQADEAQLSRIRLELLELENCVSAEALAKTKGNDVAAVQSPERTCSSA